MKNTIAIVVVSYCLLALFSRPATAQDAAIVLTVVNESGQPVSGALIEEVDGRQMHVLGLSDRNGTLVVRVAPQTHIQARSGDAFSEVAIAAGGRPIRLTLRLKVIGSVIASANGARKHVGAQNPASIAAGDVAKALGYVPGYRSAAEGGSGRQSLNGVPLDLPAAPPGTAAQGGGFPSDLVDSFDAVQADDGSFEPDYHLFAPTEQFEWSLSSGADALHGSSWKATMAGPHGKLRYALEAAGGGDQGTLAGMTIADASGLRYDHGDRAHHLDGSLVVDDSIGSVNLALVGVGSRQGNAYILNTKPGAILEGFGPGNSSSQDFGTAYLLATASRGRDSFTAIDVRYNGGGLDDLAHALPTGANLPALSGYRYSGSYDSAGWTRAFGAASLALSLATTSNLSTGFSGGFAGSEASGAQTMDASYKVTRGHNGAGVSLHASQGEGPFAERTLDASAFETRRIGAIDLRLSVSTAQSQNIEASYATSYSQQPVQTAQLVCSPGTASVVGPSQTGDTHPRSENAILSLSQTTGHATLRGGAFVSRVSNALVMAQVATTSFSPAYLNALDGFFASICPGQQLLSQDVFVQRLETVPALQQAEWYVDATRRFGSFSIETTYETFADVPRCARMGCSTGLGVTTLMSGTQIADVPLHRANVVAAFIGRTTTLALSGRFVSANNAQRLPGYVAIDAGARFRHGSGVLDASVQNAFARYGGRFVSPQYAVALPTTGAPFATLATPVQTTWTLRYTMTFGSHN